MVALPDRPKGLAPVGDRTFLEIQIQLLQAQGARHFVLCVGHQAEQIQNALGDGRRFGVQIEYSIEEAGYLLGTAGALKKAARYFTPDALVLNGDTYFDIDYVTLLQRHREAQHQGALLATLALSGLTAGERYGNVAIDPLTGRLCAFKEKDSDSNAEWVSGGAYIVERALLDYVPPDQPCSLERDIFPRLLAEGQTLAAMTYPNRFFDIGTPAAWKQFTANYLEWQDKMEDVQSVIRKQIEENLAVTQNLVEAQVGLLAQISETLTRALKSGGTLYLCGNGGSAADAQHIATEFVGRYGRDRRALPAIALTANPATLTAIGNDYDFSQIFARQVQAYVTSRDVVVGLSTSGKSLNVLLALRAAREIGAITIGFTGLLDEQFIAEVDLCLCAASKHTSRIQEVHLLAWHVICDLVEQASIE